VIKVINTIVKKKLIFLGTLIFILFINKIILSKLVIFALERWIDKEIIVSDFNIFYKKKEISINNIIIRNKDNLMENVFTAENITVNLKPNTLFTKLIIIDSIKFKNPILNLKFNISNKNDKLIEDNLGISENLKRKNNPKIYPKKIVDINFLILNSSLEELKINIKRSDKSVIETVVLSNMYFQKFGNELGHRHYKDVLKIILLDLVMKITDQELKNIIKKYYMS
tara:strand:- start:184 stop:861 length:678 start_codon:yes stop_codon:yes gene_type:complete